MALASTASSSREKGENNRKQENDQKVQPQHDQLEGVEEKETEEDNPKTLESTEKKEGQKLWVDVLSGNRSPSNGMAIEFVAPKVVNGTMEIDT